MGTKHKWIVGLLIVLSLLAILLLTPAGLLLETGVANFWRWFNNLPGMVWAPETMGSTPSGEEVVGPQAYPDADEINAILKAGHALQEQGDHEQALRRYREALVKDEEYPPTHVALAGVYLQLGREDDTLRELERAAELAPDSGFVLRQLGQLYMKRDDYEAGVAALERAREVDPEDQETRHWLGAAYLYRSYADSERAVEELEAAASLDPEDAATQYRLAMAYMRRDDPRDSERAIGALEKALLLDPSQTEAYFHLGRLYLGLDQREAATRAWRRYVMVSDDAETVKKVQAWLDAQEEGRPSGSNPAP